jgi:hypothetical protein
MGRSQAGRSGVTPVMAAKYAEACPAWGHRKIAALMRADGHVVSTSTVERALRRRGLLLPIGYRADRKSWAVIRRRVFHDPPAHRNRVWQTDFSEFEPPAAGSGGSARSSTTPPDTASLPRSTRPPAARTRSPASRPRSGTPNGYSDSMTCAPIAASSTCSMRPPANCCAPSRHPSP